MYILGIDTGTQATKTIVFDLESAKVIAESSKSYGMIDGLPDGYCEQDPAEWIRAVDFTIKACLKQLGDESLRVAAIGVSGQQHGLVVLDKENGIIRPAKLAADTSALEQCDEIARAFGGAPGLIELMGTPMLPEYTASKLLWLKQNEPENFEKIETLLLPHNFINYWLTGVKHMEPSEASGTGFFDVRNRQWSKEVVDFIDPAIHNALPEMGTSMDVLGAIRPELADAWGLGHHVLISAGGGDCMMRALSTGNIKSGHITVALGERGVVCGVQDKPLIDPRGEVTAFCDATGQWLPVITTMSAVRVTDAVREHYDWDLERMEEEVSASPVGAEGLMMLPYLDGEGSSGHLPEDCGVLHGLTLANFKPNNVMRAAMEGVSLSLGYGLQRLIELGAEPTSVRLTGEGAKSQVWRQMLSDVFGLPVVALETEECAALGAALQASVSFFNHNGEDLSYEEIVSYAVKVSPDTVCKPDEERHEFYQALLAQQQYLVETLHTPGFL